jgi:chromate reductase
MAAAHPRVAGSLRASSLNRALLARGGTSWRRTGIGDRRSSISPGAADQRRATVDGAQGDPPGVAAFKQAIAAADGVLMATPEYNHGVPG